MQILSIISKKLDDLRIHISKNNKLVQLIIFIFIILESLLLVISFFPEIDKASALNTDFMFHMNRFYGLSQALEFETYPFYINTHSLAGYGYGVNLFYPDLCMLPFAFLIKPLGLAWAYKIMIFTYTVFCGIFSYYAIKKITRDNLISFLFIILYNFALYKVVDFAYRGAVAEFLAFTFIPLIFNGLYEILSGNYKKKWYIISIGFFCLINTHLISALIMAVIVCVYIILYRKRIKDNPKRLYYLFLAGFICILLSSFFIITLIEQLLSNEFYLTRYPLVSQIMTSSPKSVIMGLFTGMDGNRLTLQTLGILISLSLLVRLTIRDKSELIKIADLNLIFGLILLFSISHLFPWNIFPFYFLNTIQFSFRLLLPISLIMSFAGAIYISYIIKRNNHYFSILSLSFFMTFFMIYTTGEVLRLNKKNVITNNKNELYNIDIMDTVLGEFLPAQIPFPTSATELKLGNYYYRIAFILNRNDSIIYNPILSSVSSVKRNNEFFNFNIFSESENSYILPLIFYKGYKATLNDEDLKIEKSVEGLVEIKSNKSGDVKVWYNGTVLQKIAFWISIATIIILTIHILLINKKQKKLKI